MKNLFENLLIFNFIRTQYINQAEEGQKKESIRRHRHEYYQLMYIRYGNGVIMINDKEFEVSEGDVVSIKNNEPHSIIPTSDFLKTYELKFGFKDNNYDFLKDIPSFSFRDENNAIKRAMSQIENEFDQRTNFDKEIILLDSIRILYFIKRAYLADETLKKESINNSELEIDDMLFNRVNSYVNERINENVTVNDIAVKLHMDYSYLSHSFRKKYGISLKQFLTEKKMALVKDLLSTSDMSITEIAEKCGFETIHKMDGIFKKVCGVTPSEFRRNFKKNNCFEFEDKVPKSFYE